MILLTRFVSLDGTSDEIVDVLLALRNKKFKGEHEIKARLKTESAVKSVDNGVSNYYTIQQHSEYSNKYVGNFGNGGGAENTPHYRRYGHSGNKYGTNNSFGYRNRYQLTPAYENRRFGGPRGRHRYSVNNPKHFTKDNKVVPVVPPPPSEDETHYPSLGGGGGGGSVASKSPTPPASSAIVAST